MSHARRLKECSTSAKDYNSDFCEECDSALKQISSNSKLSQGTYKSDVISDAASKRNDDKENLVDDGKVLLTVTVEIEEECMEMVQLKEGDSAETVASQFCREHGLPDQFVAPLTEHIVSNIVSGTNEDRTDIKFHPQEEIMSNDENSPLRSGSPETKQQPRPLSAESNACMLARREPRKMEQKTSQAASQKVERPLECCYCCRPSPPPRRKARRRKRGRKTFSARLVAPTFTSLARSGALDRYLKKSKSRIRPLSKRARAVCMRLHTEHIGHSHGRKYCRYEVKRNSWCQHNISRRKVGLSKKSWWLSRTRGKIAKQYRNYGELLYAEGLTMKQNHIKAVHERTKQVESRELAEVTFIPKISKRSRKMSKSQDLVWSRLQSDDRPKQDQLQELRQEVREAKLMECTFRPHTNRKRRFDGQENYNDYCCNRFVQLFLDAESRRRRRAESMQWYPEGVTFMPSINRGIPYGTSMMGNKCQQEHSVFHRLVENAAKVMEKKQVRKQLSHRPFDPQTGRELFKPHIGRKPSNRNPVHLPIGEYLHRMNCVFNKKIRNLAAKENKIKKEQAQGRHVGPNSRRLIERLKDHGLQQVFDFLDMDKDGYVDLATANFDRLNSDVIDDLKRLMKMDAGKEKLGYDEFEDLMIKTEEKYHKDQQVHLGLKHKRHNDGDHCTFKFKMDQLSRHLAKERRKFSTHEQWWQIIFAEYIANLQKIEKWRKQQLQQEMAECTFKPCLIRVRVGNGSNRVRCTKDGVGQTITDMYEKVQQEVHEFCLHNKHAGPEVMGMPGTPQSMRSRQCVKRGLDVISALDDLPKTKTGLFLGVMGA